MNNDHNQVRGRILNHFQDLQDFAGLPEAERKEIMTAVLNLISDRFQTEPFHFQVAAELLIRLSQINRAPHLATIPVSRAAPNPANDSAELLAEIITDAFGRHGAEYPGGLKSVVAASAVFICFGTSGKLANCSHLLIKEAGGRRTVIELPFSIADEIICKGHAAIMDGREQSREDLQFFKDIIKYDFLDIISADEAEQLYNTQTFLFYAFDGTDKVTAILNDIIFDDDIISAGEIINARTHSD